MSATPQQEADPPTYCAAHPDVETELHCNRCDTPICPRCLVQTPVGARCRACARLHRPPMYDVGPGVLAKAVPASLLTGAAMGVAWGLLLPGGFGLGLFGLLIAIFIGSPIGYGFAAVLDRVTNRKRGPTMQGIAVAGLVLAFLVQAAVSGAVQGNLFGLVLTAAACSGAISRLR